MISGDDTFLSAYMDGQLDFDQQQAVESALVDSPELAESLRELTAVRELLAGLPREAGADISSEVMARILGRNRSRPRSLLPSLRARAWAGPSQRVAAVAGAFTVAAGIMLIVAVTIAVRPREHGPRAEARDTANHVIADSRIGAGPAAANKSRAPVSLDPGSSASKVGTISSTALETSALASSRDEGRALASDRHPVPIDLELARRMLDNPAERRFFFIKNGEDGKTEQQVAGVVERMTRFGYFKIAVPRGLVIDPGHPDQATVFAVLVNRSKLARMRDDLREGLPGVIDEAPADPRIVTQLADIGHVQELAPTEMADVSISRDALALRTRVGGGDGLTQSAPTSGEREKAALPTPEQYRSAPNSATARSGSADPEHNTAVAAAGDGSRALDAPTSGRAPFSDSISRAEVVPSRTDETPRASDAAKLDEMILVFVWICQSRPG